VYERFQSRAAKQFGRRSRPWHSRAVYHPAYYGAFVLDTDGHNVAVVNHNR
jgi:hypothetical protein